MDKTNNICVSIIIVNYNTKHLTSNCIDSVISKTRDISYEIVIVDNNSTDGSKELFEKDSRITYIYNDENKGFGVANNIGFEKSHGKYLFFLNSDTLLINNAVKELADTLDGDEKAGVVGGNLYNREDKLILSHSKFYISIPFVLDEILLRIPSHLTMRNRDNNKSNRVVRVAYVSGADLMIRRELFEKYKFDPHFFMYNEEVDLCLQVHRAGYKILSNPESKITHLVGSSSKTASKSLINEKKLKMQRESLNYYMHKNHTESYRFFFYLLGKISAGLRTIEFALVGKNEYRRMWSYVYHKSKISDYK